MVLKHPQYLKKSTHVEFINFIYFSDITKFILKRINKALFVDELGLGHSDALLKVIEFNLKRSLPKIVDYFDKWSLLLKTLFLGPSFFLKLGRVQMYPF